MTFSLSNLLHTTPYSLNRKHKAELYRQALSDLTLHHYESCQPYRQILNALGYDPAVKHISEDQPMLPVRLFKAFDLRSVPESSVMKTMTSSGTTGQSVSQVFLDKENSMNQTRVLSGIITSFIGKKRLPLLILDTARVRTDRTMFSARGAGVIGFSMFGRETLFALDENMRLDITAVKAFLQKYHGETILLFGYTYIIWLHVLLALRDAGECLGIEDGVLFHVGGWKKLKDQAVDTASYNQAVIDAVGNTRIYNYYGMAEQLGSIFVECEHGHMHCSVYSDIIIRRHEDFSCAAVGERGLIELLSLLPTSYPGHVLLTEDEGEILGEDDCLCGRLGKYFRIHGRIKGAELRGCSDTYEAR